MRFLIRFPYYFLFVYPPVSFPSGHGSIKINELLYLYASKTINEDGYE